MFFNNAFEGHPRKHSDSLRNNTHARRAVKWDLETAGNYSRPGHGRNVDGSASSPSSDVPPVILFQKQKTTCQLATIDHAMTIDCSEA